MKVADFGWILCGEDVNAQRWLGIAVIVVGIVIVARSGSAA